MIRSVLRNLIIAWLSVEVMAAAIGLAWPWLVVYAHAPNLFHIVPDYLVQP